MGGADRTSGEDDLPVRGEVVEPLVGTAGKLDPVDNGCVAIGTSLENLDDLGVDENVEIAARQRGLDVVPARVRPRTVLNLFPPSRT